MPKMRLHIISWLVLLMSCGICICDEGYFEAAHDDYRKLCLILAFPGRHNGPDPDNFNATWNKYLNIAGESIFNSSDKQEQLKEAEDFCKESKTDNDLICAFRDFSTIGNLVEHDVRKLQETLSYTFESNWYYFAHYIAAWFQHPRMARLDCGPTLKHLWVFMAKLSRLQSLDVLFRMKSVYDNVNAKGLRQEIDRFCTVSSSEKMCKIKTWTNTADKIDKFLTYVTRDQWYNNASEILKNALRLYFYAVKLEFLEVHPSSEAQGFLSTEDSEVNKWIKEITFYLFDSLEKNQIQTIGAVLELLPSTVDLPCDHAAQFPSMKRTICTFNGIIDSLSGYLVGKNRRGNIKQISTTIDYEKFLQEKRFEQILNIGETAQRSLLIVAQHVKLRMQNNFEELKNYFKQIANFDRKIALVDIDYIGSTLDMYKNASVQSSKTIDSLMNEIIKAALAAVIGDQVETVLKLSFRMAEACNPLKLVFDGGSAVDLLEATQGVSQAMVNVAKAAKLKDALDSLIKEVRTFVDKLSKNELYLNSVVSFINNLKTVESSSSSSSSSEFKAQKNTFLDAYNNYNPAVTKDDLRAITVSWEILIDEACDIIDSTSGTVSGITKTILTAKRTCPNAKVEVQKMITIYEEIYDFQFQLMDALMTCMRAFTSSEAANVINSDFDAAKLKGVDNPEIIDELQFLSAFSMICYKISILTAIDSYCDILTYTEGHLPRECIGAETSITSLLSRTKLTCTTLLEFQSIPTKPSKPGDKAYINLKDLYAEKNVVFKIPDSEWLIDHNWISSYQRHDKMFVQRFEIYVPVVSKTKNQRTATDQNQTKDGIVFLGVVDRDVTNHQSESVVQVQVQATVGNQLTPPDGTEYVIYPRTKLRYTYREGEGGSECRQKEIRNPYNDNCRDMPKICAVTKASSACDICSSIYAQWNIKMYGYKDANLTVPSTDIPLKVALQLCVLHEKEYSLRQAQDYNNEISKLLHAVEQQRNRKVYHSKALRSNGKCCGSNQYYDEKLSTCTECPSGTVDKYKGLFCGNTIRFVPAPTNETTFSLDNARSACTKAGTIVASTQDMQEAVARGYDKCGCGWLSDGTMAAPKPNDSCKENGGLSTVICSSSNIWGVYCINIF